MATKDTIVEEDLVLSDDSTVGYGGSSEYESDCSTDEYPIYPIASTSTWDNKDSYGSSLEGSGDEEVIEIDGDDGNFANDTWRFMVEDYSSEKLLDRYPLSPLGVAGHPKNCIPPESKPEEYDCMFLDKVIIQVIVVDTNHNARAKIAAREYACPDKIHCPWRVDIMLEEMIAVVGLVINMSLTHKGDVREYSGDSFFRVVFHREIVPQRYCTTSVILGEGSVHRLRKLLYLVQHLCQQYQRFYVPVDAEYYVCMQVLLAEPQPPNICRTNIPIVR